MIKTLTPDLLGQIVAPFETFMSDGAYDGDPVSQSFVRKGMSAVTVGATIHF